MMSEVLELLQEASHQSMSATQDRMAAATMWKTVASVFGSPSTSELEAIKTILSLLDIAVAESTSLEGISNRLTEEWTFKDAQGAASDGAALAIGSGNLSLAVSLLEQGRSIIYTQLGRYRSVIDDIRKASPNLAERLVDQGLALDALVVRGERTISNSHVKMKPFDDNASR